jgi:hypothetical protein
MKIYKLCDMTRHTYDMELYVEKYRTPVTVDVTAIHAAV